MQRHILTNPKYHQNIHSNIVILVIAKIIVIVVTAVDCILNSIVNAGLPWAAQTARRAAKQSNQKLLAAAC